MQQFRSHCLFTVSEFIDMEILPSNAVEQLEFDKIIDQIAAFSVSDSGSDAVCNLQFYSDQAIIEKQLDEVAQLKNLIEEGEDISITPFDIIDRELTYLSKENYVLTIEEIQKLNKILVNFQIIEKVIHASRSADVSQLKAIIEGVELEQALIKRIRQVINDEGEIKQNASSELFNIFKSIKDREKEILRAFNKIVSEYSSKGLLTDSKESYRNGRRVLSVPSEYKRRINGIIHDESHTQRTTFIEPQAVVVVNNQIMELEIEKKKEIYKILKDLCNDLRPHIESIRLYTQIITYVDFVRAKAKYAMSIDAQRPTILPRPRLDYKMGVHPLLYTKNKALAVPTVPFEISIRKPSRIVLISGPNAGGKSVTMKGVGLIQLLIQSGNLAPVDENSKIGIFKNILVDIGDQQSLEDDLSTYSSRLKNMKIFLEHADKDSLILIDEFGSGTDPKIGGSIAEAILTQLNSRKSWGVITTHYSNLKIFAYKTKGIVNAAMFFDNKGLKPTYEINIGKPGSSFAFEIAEKVGLPPDILEYAKKKTGKNEKAIDKLLVDLLAEKKELENKLKRIVEKEDRADHLIKNYDNLYRELEFQRKKFKLEKRQFSMNENLKDEREIQKVIKELKKKANVGEARALLSKMSNKRKGLSEDIVSLTDEVNNVKYSTDDIKEGSHVKIRASNAVGVVTKIKKGKADVMVGNLNMQLSINELIPIQEQISIVREKSVQTHLTTSTEGFETKLDIRGYRHSEALQFIQEFMDTALITNQSSLSILHGKGNGVLKKTVRNKLKEYKEIKEIFHPEEGEGGEGITVIKL